MKRVRDNKKRRMQWMHFTIVWLIGSILTTLGVFVANKQFDGFFSLIIPVIVVGIICWKVTRKDLQFVYEERSRDFFSYMSCMMLLAVAMLMNTGLRYSTGEKAKVDRLTANNAKQYDYLEVMDLELDTSKTGTYVYQRVQRDRYSTNLEFEGILVIQVKGLNDVYVTRKAISSCSYDYASNEKIEETYQEVVEKLQKIKEKTPLHSHCYLSKFDKNESTGYQNSTKAVIESGINDPGEEDNFVFFGISTYDDGNPLWKNIKISGIVLAIWMMITGAAFRFTKEKKHRRIRTKDEPSTKGGKTVILNLLVIFWPVTAILLACIIMFVVELAMGYDETSLGGEILYKLGALNSYAIYEDQQWWRLFTYAFLHGSFRHLFGNILSLLIVSFFMTPEVKPMGQAAVFLASSLFSGLAFLAFSQGIVVGASGGIFGMAGTYITLSMYTWIKTGRRQEGLVVIGAICIINLLLSFARTTSMTGHISGMACGFMIAIGIIIYRELKANGNATAV